MRVFSKLLQSLLLRGSEVECHEFRLEEYKVHGQARKQISVNTQ
jgi:hypothetical protein